MVPSAAEFVDRLQGAGRYTFTDAELSDALGVADLGVRVIPRADDELIARLPGRPWQGAS